MSDGSAGTTSRQLARLATLEELRALKARYFRLMDTKRWDEWADVFSPDLTAWVEDQGDLTYEGREEFVRSVSRTLAEAVTVHHGHMPELEITEWEGDRPLAAEGTWAMADYVEFPRPEGSFVLYGYGHYHEQYRRGQDGRWRIVSLRLSRLRVDHQSRGPATSDAARASG